MFIYQNLIVDQNAYTAFSFSAIEIDILKKFPLSPLRSIGVLLGLRVDNYNVDLWETKSIESLKTL